jgi:hypothetical protein
MKTITILSLANAFISCAALAYGKETQAKNRVNKLQQASS